MKTFPKKKEYTVPPPNFVRIYYWKKNRLLFPEKEALVRCKRKLAHFYLTSCLKIHKFHSTGFRGISIKLNAIRFAIRS
jgi:hypothetical protein